MQRTRFHAFLMCGALLLLAGPLVLGQPGGGPPGGGRGGRGGRGGGGGGGGAGGAGRFDPNMFFNLLSGGKDFIVVADMLANPMISARDPSAKDRVESFMQRHGITEGRLTREQFAQYLEERMAERRAERGATAPGGPSSPGAAPSDGVPGAEVGPEAAPPEEEKRPVVYRAGKLPKELPPWFAQMDEDKDGQVGLYEWKKAGRSLNEFQAMDLNGDGFVTVEEALRYMKGQGRNVASSGGSGGFGDEPSFGSCAPSLGKRVGRGPPSFGGGFGGRPSFGGQPGMGGQGRDRSSFGGPGRDRSSFGGPSSSREGPPPSFGGPQGGQGGQGGDQNFRQRRRRQE